MAMGYPTDDQCGRSTESETYGLAAEGPNGERGANHHAWEVDRREWRKRHRRRVRSGVPKGGCRSRP